MLGGSFDVLSGRSSTPGYPAIRLRLIASSPVARWLGESGLLRAWLPIPANNLQIVEYYLVTSQPTPRTCPLGVEVLDVNILRVVPIRLPVDLFTVLEQFTVHRLAIDVAAIHRTPI